MYAPPEPQPSWWQTNLEQIDAEVYELERAYRASDHSLSMWPAMALGGLGQGAVIFAPLMWMCSCGCYWSCRRGRDERAVSERAAASKVAALIASTKSWLRLRRAGAGVKMEKLTAAPPCKTTRKCAKPSCTHFPAEQSDGSSTARRGAKDRSCCVRSCCGRRIAATVACQTPDCLS